MTKKIHDLLRDIETNHGIEILYACESGSRAWGFASPDSDYDIRFLYRRPMVASFTINEGSDTIEIPIENDLDPGGWDIRKALGLLQKSNGALIEWLHSPIVYHAHPEFLTDLRHLAHEHLSRKALANHYRGLAGQFFRNKLTAEMPSAKGYLYCLRALLAARHVLEHGKPPPVPFVDLIPTAPDEVADAIRDLVAWKADASENESPGRQNKLDAFIQESLPAIGTALDELPNDPTSHAPFNEALHRWSLWPKTVNRNPVYKDSLTLDRVRQPDVLLFEAVSGSRAFGTHHKRSDLDLRGIFVAPESFLAGLETIDQVSDEKSDEVYYEIGRFVSLLLANNPNIIELLFTPENCIRHCHPAFDLLKPKDFLSKLCRQTFGNYAMSQIRKSRGLNKKIVNPQPEKRHPLRYFCHILSGQGSVRLDDWLTARGIDENDLGLVSTPHATNTYAVFHDKIKPGEMRGIFSRKDDTAILCTSVGKEAEPIAWLACNLDAFKAHCKAHREYWDWVQVRNEERYETNTTHNRGYDSKNLMHTLRLLDQATEIATKGCITLPRPNCDWLKRVKSGAFSYGDLLSIAEEMHNKMETAFDKSDLRELPDRNTATEVLLAIRGEFG